jgi:hypothetical protein
MCATRLNRKKSIHNVRKPNFFEIKLWWWWSFHTIHLNRKWLVEVFQNNFSFGIWKSLFALKSYSACLILAMSVTISQHSSNILNKNHVFIVKLVSLTPKHIIFNFHIMPKLYFTFLFSLFVFVSTAGQYNVIWTGTGLPHFRFGSGMLPALLF